MLVNFIRKYSLLLFCSLLSIVAGAQSFSYVYIQGDKETPFYIKMDDQMLPRYGKNYNIISQLAPGPITVQVLFQQNAFPSQKFTIQVPENGYRGFLLVRKGDGFSLYDLQQQFYLPAGNSIADDHAPSNSPGNSYVTTKATVIATQDEIVKPTSTETPKKAVNTQPQFIENIELNDKRTVQTNTVTTTPPVTITNTPPEQVQQAQTPTLTPVQTTPAQVPTVTSTPTQQVQAQVPTPAPVQTNTTPAPVKTRIVNSDCPAPIGVDEYEDILEKMTQKTDKTRLKFLLSKLDKCYTTKQIYDLTMGLPNDPERYAFLKQSYSRVTDQVNFPSLEELLKTQEWRSYFRLIMP